MREWIRTLFLLLAQHPHAGQATDLPGVRRLAVSPYPYRIFYRVTGNEVIVQRVRHTSRRPLSASGASWWSWGCPRVPMDGQRSTHGLRRGLAPLDKGDVLLATRLDRPSRLGEASARLATPGPTSPRRKGG